MIGGRYLAVANHIAFSFRNIIDKYERENIVPIYTELCREQSQIQSNHDRDQIFWRSNRAFNAVRNGSVGIVVSHILRHYRKVC